ncbi:murein biosynthesis integral membrane protein MurJ [Ilumatobacter sp.]|uniref:murein biosynthesis integral membrane protein MurJ n=1 Tax=Ilumatobacter sp. TaxID=1967498 RepID=UPI003AF4281D
MSRLLRSNLTVAAGTALSRVTGLLRVMVFAFVIGQNLLADSYKIANETPNIVYDLLLGGVLSATLVPLFSSFMGTEDEEGDDRATNAVITIASTLMVAITVVAVVLAPLIFRLYSLNLADGVDADLFRQVGTTLTRIFLVQILFYGLTGIANAYLNSRRRFFVAAWSPILPNVIIIVTLLSLPGAGDTAWTLEDVLADDRLRWTLGLGATAGIAAMALAVVPAMVAAGLRFRPTFDWRHPAVRKLLSLSVWTIGFVAANQVALLVVRNLALGQGGGIAASYFDAFTWFVLPHGLLAVSIATTFQPEMARSVVRKDRTGFIDQTSLGVRLIVLLTLPAAAGMFVLRDPIIGLMQRGQFDAVDAFNTSRALAGLSIGLVGFSVYLFVLRGFYAHQDTRTPFVLNVGENLLNVVLAFVLVGRWGVLGLGLAYAGAYVVSAVWALTVLRDKVRGFSVAVALGGVWKMVLAAVLMAEAIWFVTRDAAVDTGWQALGQIVVGGLAGIVVYVVVLLILRTGELEALRNRVLRRTG